MQNCTRKNQEIFLQHKMHLCNAVQVVEFRRRQNDEPSKKDTHKNTSPKTSFWCYWLSWIVVSTLIYILLSYLEVKSPWKHTCMFKIGAGAVFGRCRSKPLQLQRPITLNPFFSSWPKHLLNRLIITLKKSWREKKSEKMIYREDNNMC